MKVICKAAIYARDQGWRGSVDPMDIADLMDAIHNIPELVQNWERCDVELLRKSFLGVYQDKWSARGGPALRDIFDQVVQAK
jgi:hypothetical protein